MALNPLLKKQFSLPQNCCNIDHYYYGLNCIYPYNNTHYRDFTASQTKSLIDDMLYCDSIRRKRLELNIKNNLPLIGDHFSLNLRGYTITKVDKKYIYYTFNMPNISIDSNGIAYYITPFPPDGKIEISKLKRSKFPTAILFYTPAFNKGFERILTFFCAVHSWEVV